MQVFDERILRDLAFRYEVTERMLHWLSGRDRETAFSILPVLNLEFKQLLSMHDNVTYIYEGREPMAANE